MKRGEVYNLRCDNGVGFEMGTFRPAVIVSSQDGLDKSGLVTIVYTTTSRRNMSVAVELITVKRRSWALCNQIYTIDRSRIEEKNYMCCLSDAEMREIDEALKIALGLPSEKEVVVEKIVEPEPSAANESVLGLKVELATYKAMYEKAIEKLVAERIARDTELIKVPVEEPKIHKEEVEKPKVGRPKKIKEVEEPKPERVPLLKGSRRANINRDTPENIRDLTGISLPHARMILKFGREVGGFSSVSDVTEVPRIGEAIYAKYGNMLEV